MPLERKWPSGVKYWQGGEGRRVGVKVGRAGGGGGGGGGGQTEKRSGGDGCEAHSAESLLQLLPVLV